MDNPANDLNKAKPNRFETDIMLNGKTKFQDSNTIINSLQDEILTLKEKMKFVYEKDEEIQKLKYEIDKMNKEASELASNQQELFRLDNLIQQYKIENNSKISKSIMEKMLKEAIHL